jgi:hypothetical protein
VLPRKYDSTLHKGSSPHNAYYGLQSRDADCIFLCVLLAREKISDYETNYYLIAFD